MPTVHIKGAEVDPCDIQLPIEIVHGRSGVDTQPDSPTTSIVYEGAAIPWTLGDPFDIYGAVQYEPAVYDSPTVTYDSEVALYDDDGTGIVQRPRFVGVIAGITARADLGAVQAWEITAVGRLGRLGFVPILLTRPQESDVARVRAICAAAGTPVRVLGTAGVQLAAGTVDDDALTALHKVCESTGGLVWQATDGAICYGTADHRISLPDPVGVVPCYALESQLSWTETVDTIVNEVTVSWGPDTGQSEATHRDAESAAMPWGTRHVSVRTSCATETDADQLAVLILARRAWPYWAYATAVVAVSDLDPDDSRLFAELDVSTPVLVPIPTDPGPTPGELSPVVVEGWIETWTEGGEHYATAAFSDQHRWVTTSLRDYAEVLADGDYAHWLANGDYLDLLVKEG